MMLLAIAAGTGVALAQDPIEIAYAGSMGALMDRGIAPAIAKSFNAELHGRAQGSRGLANLIVAGSIRPDVFIAVTPGPMRAVLKAGKADRAIAIARTEMVIAYSPKSRFAAQFSGGKAWWRILESPEIRFGRTDPNVDPQGLGTIFTVKLAETYYHQPELMAKILGPQINPRQIFQEAEVMARLQTGQLDASAAYKTQPGAMNLPFVTLPNQINLGDAAMEQQYRQGMVMLNGKPKHPSPLVFYAAAMNGAAHPLLARKFIAWLTGAGARAILTQFHYDPPGDAPPLAP